MLKYPLLSKKYPSKTAFITGAAAGLGRALATQLAADGWRLALNDRNKVPLRNFREELESRGATAIDYCFDVTEAASFASSVADATDRFGTIDLLINNAGLGAGGYLHDFAIEHWREVFEANVIGTAIGVRSVLPSMRQRNSGHILNIASASAYHNLPYIGAYSATKAAVVSLTETLKGELAGTGVSCSVMISGFFKSSLDENTIGEQLARDKTAGLMLLSPLSAEQVAAETLQGLEQQRFYIVLGGQARLFYMLKRHFPQLMLALAPKIARKAFAKALTAYSGKGKS